MNDGIGDEDRFDLIWELLGENSVPVRYLSTYSIIVPVRAKLTHARWIISFFWASSEDISQLTFSDLA